MSFRFMSTLLALSLVALLWGIACSPEPPQHQPDGDADADADDGGGNEDADDPVEDTDVDDAPDVIPDSDEEVEVDADEETDRVGTCEACEDNNHDLCQPGSYCINLSEGGQACVEGCDPEFNTCPRGFECVLSLKLGVDTTVCAPVGGPCCVDEDADDYGQGVGCLGDDCNDEAPDINPGAQELCNEIDDDCDDDVDDPPTDCLGGRCADEGDGTYSAITNAECIEGDCASGDVTDCGLFTCEGSGALGDFCATTCNVDGAEDDSFCIESAHCDMGECFDDVENGGECNEATDCVSGYCNNGFCCEDGTCCGGSDDDCGVDISYICVDTEDCRGERGETTCNEEYQCETTDGIPDDTGCHDELEARDCGPYGILYCTGDPDQAPPVCPTSCATDGQCADGAHCSGGDCRWDLTQGNLCDRDRECEDRRCVDSRCCDSTCGGECESCANTDGECRAVPAGTDPDSECGGFACTDYYTGFDVGDTCYRRDRVDDTEAVCNGARECSPPDTMCPLQPIGETIINCDDTCQEPTPGTCVEGTPGRCDDLDAVAGTHTCGLGICENTVDRCRGGRPNPCDPLPVARVETCNSLDDDCDGTPDDGDPDDLCGGHPTISSSLCTDGVCGIESCVTDYFSVNDDYDDGCECHEDTYGIFPNPRNNTCGDAFDLGTIERTESRDVFGRLIPVTGRDEDWYAVAFPTVNRSITPGGTGGVSDEGTVVIYLAVEDRSDFRLDVLRGTTPCTSDLYVDCNGVEPADGDGDFADGVTELNFWDDPALTTGGRTWQKLESVAWPANVRVRVYRAPAADPIADCTDGAEGDYELHVGRE